MCAETRRLSAPKCRCNVSQPQGHRSTAAMADSANRIGDPCSCPMLASGLDSLSSLAATETSFSRPVVDVGSTNAPGHLGWLNISESKRILNLNIIINKGDGCKANVDRPPSRIRRGRVATEGCCGRAAIGARRHRCPEGGLRASQTTRLNESTIPTPPRHADFSANRACTSRRGSLWSTLPADVANDDGIGGTTIRSCTHPLLRAQYRTSSGSCDASRMPYSMDR